MKQVLGLIFFPPALSRSVARVREFRRCPEHDNLLAYDGRALSVEEFNRVAPKLLGDGAKSLYGVQPIAKLVEVDVSNVSAAPVANVPPVVVPAAPVIDLPKVTIEPSGDGFVLVNYEGEEARYMGASLAWETDVSLVIPFATEDEARGSAPGGIIAQPPEVEEGAVDDSLSANSGASQPPVEEEASPAETSAEASTSDPQPSVQPVVDPKNIRETVQAAQFAKRKAKAERNAPPPPKKVTPPTIK
jgi:hypothetical protein